MKKLAYRLLPHLVCILTLLGLASCSVTDGDGNAFLGQSSSQLLSSMGTPQLRAPDGQGGEIWTYIQETGGVGMSSTGVRGTGGYGAVGGPATASGGSLNPQGFTSRREFLIDSHGIIYKYRSRGY